MDSRRIRSLLEAEGVASRDLFCTIHVCKEKRIAVIYSSHPEPERLSGWQSYGEGVVGDTAKTLKYHVISDVSSYPNYYGVYPNVASELAIPIIMGRRPAVVINFESTQHSFFSDRVPQFEVLSSRVAEFLGSAAAIKANTFLLPEQSLLKIGSEEQLRIEITAISDQLITTLAKEPALLHELTPRKFEELIGRILEDQGFSVTLTPIQKDGGFDLLAEARLETGRVLTLVECKKWSPERPVGVEVVRNLYGVLEIEKATNAMIATTSRFTSGALRLEDARSYRLNLRDFNAISSWLKRYKD